MELQKSSSAIIGKYASSKFYRQGLSLILSFLRPKILGPENFGLWTLIQSIPTYTLSADVGTKNATRILVPPMLAKGEAEQIEAVKSTSFFCTMAVNLAISLVCLLLAFFAPWSIELRAGLVTLAIVVALQGYHQYYLSVLTAYEEFPLITRHNYVRTTIVFIVSVPLIVFLGLYGVYIAFIVSFVIPIVYLHLKSKHPLAWTFDWTLLKSLVVIGFPAMLINLFVTLIVSSDRFIIASFLGKEEVGHYGIAVLVMGFLRQVPGSAAEILEPRMLSTMHERSKDQILMDYLVKPTIRTAYMMPFVIAPLVIFLPIFLPMVLPKYIPGIAPTQILTVGVWFLALTHPPRLIIIAYGWQRQAAWLMPFLLGANLLIAGLMVSNFGLMGAALASVVSFILMLVVMMLFINRRLEGHSVPLGRYALLALLPVLVLIGTLALVLLALPLLISNGYVLGGVGAALSMGCLGWLYWKVSHACPLLIKPRLSRA